MRDDMHKVVVERERHGGSFGNKGYDRETRVRDFEDEFDRLDSQPRHEGMMAQYHYDRKSFSDVLNPLKGFFHKNVGRPWNKVKSEMQRVIGRQSVQHQHVWSHVKDFVNEDIVAIDGKLFEKRIGYRYHKEAFLAPLDHTNNRVELFVDPRTGLLRKNKWYRVYHFGREKRVREEVRRETKDSMVQLHKFKGIWYEVTLAPSPVLLAADPASHCAPSDLQRTYGRAGVYGVSKRALNSKRLRAEGLENDRPALAA